MNDGKVSLLTFFWCLLLTNNFILECPADGYNIVDENANWIFVGPLLFEKKPSSFIAVCMDSYVVYAVVLTQWENENDSQNQWEMTT